MTTMRMWFQFKGGNGVASDEGNVVFQQLLLGNKIHSITLLVDIKLTQFAILESVNGSMMSSNSTYPVYQYVRDILYLDVAISKLNDLLHT